MDKVNKDIHEQLDIIVTGNRNVQTISENNNLTNENRKMKRTIRLTESELRQIINESVKRVLKESETVNNKSLTQKQEFINYVKSVAPEEAEYMKYEDMVDEFWDDYCFWKEYGYNRWDSEDFYRMPEGPVWVDAGEYKQGWMPGTHGEY